MVRGSEKHSFIEIAKTPVAIGGEAELIGFIIGELAGKGPANKEALRSPHVQVSYKRLLAGAKEEPHGHGPDSREFVFVLNHNWGPIRINGGNPRVVSPGEFTLVRGGNVSLEWKQSGRTSKVLVVKEPSMNDKKAIARGEMGAAEEDFLVANFIKIASGDEGLIASPNHLDERLRTTSTGIYYYQTDFPFRPDFTDGVNKTLVLVVGGHLSFEAANKRTSLGPGGMSLLSPGTEIKDVALDASAKIFTVKFSSR